MIVPHEDGALDSQGACFPFHGIGLLICTRIEERSHPVVETAQLSIRSHNPLSPSGDPHLGNHTDLGYGSLKLFGYLMYGPGTT